MEDIRQAFHDIANHLNKIAVIADTKAEIIKSEGIDSMSQEKLKQELKEAQQTLLETAEYAVTAGKAMHELKKNIYSALKIDTSKPPSHKESP